MRLYIETGRKAFRRASTYLLANLTGLTVNSFFGYIHCYVFVAVYASVQTAQVANYSLGNAISFVWFSQAMITVCQIWFDKDISQTIVTGDVVSDFAKPFDYQTFWFSRFVGNSLYALLVRGIPTYAVGILFFGAQLPQHVLTVPLFALSLALSVTVSFLIGYMVNLTTFWTLSPAGMLALGATVQMFFSGFIVPLAYMPDWLATVANVLPFQAIINSPLQIWLEQDQSWTVLLLQAFWVVALWVVAHGLTTLAQRKVTLQGG